MTNSSSEEHNSKVVYKILVHLWCFMCSPFLLKVPTLNKTNIYIYLDLFIWISFKEELQSSAIKIGKLLSLKICSIAIISNQLKCRNTVVKILIFIFIALKPNTYNDIVILMLCRICLSLISHVSRYLSKVIIEKVRNIGLSI